MSLRDNRRKKAFLDHLVECHVCLTKEPLATAEDHHIIPRANGGSDDPSNRKWLCGSCHGRLHRVQHLLVANQVATAFNVCETIFPSDGGARGRLWELSNVAAQSTEVRVSNTVKVSLEMDRDVWAMLKSQAKGQRVTAKKAAENLLETAIRGRL